MSYLEIVNQRLNEIRRTSTNTERILDGRRVESVVWETKKAVIFRDPEGHYWRYLYDWGKAWPVVIVKRANGRL